MDEDIDIELLISLVKERPVLWNKNLEQYKSRNLTVAAWRDVCCALHEGFDYFSDDKKNDFGKHVVKKWTNVKDSWVKAQKRNREHNNFVAKTRRKYIYQEKLSFLNENFISKDTESNSMDFKIENEDSNLNEYNSQSPTSQASSAESTIYSRSTTRPWSRFKRMRRDDSAIMRTNNNLEAPESSTNSTLESPEFKSINILEAPEPELRTTNNLETSELRITNTFEASDFRTNNTFEAPEDRHICFFKGILPSLHQLNEEETLQFQMGVLNVLHEIRTAKSIFVEPLNSSQCQ